MKTTLIRIITTEDRSYYIGIGIGFELEPHLGWFAGIVIQFFQWTIRIGIDREMD